MNFKPHELELFREKYALAKLTKVEQFQFNDELILMEYAKGVLDYFDKVGSTGIDLEWLNESMECSKRISAIKNIPPERLVFLIKEIWGKQRLVVCVNSPEGMIPVFIHIDIDLFNEIKG